MNRIEQVVLESAQSVINSNGLNYTVDLNTNISRESGIDSMGIVLLIMGIEEKLDIDLSNNLKDIREATNLGQIVEIIMGKS